ncbi:MAG: DUF885 family protein [Sphingomonas sp.]
MASAVALPGVVRADSGLGRAAADANDTARSALDAAAAMDSAETRYRLLRKINIAAVTGSRRADVDAALLGAAAEAGVARDFPFAGAMAAPFAVSPMAGAWRSAGTPDAQAGAALVRTLDAETERVRMAGSMGIALPSSAFAVLLPSFDTRAGRIEDPIVAAAFSRQRAVLVAASAAVPPGDGLGRSPQGRRLYAGMLQLQAGEAVAPETFHARMVQLCDDLSRRADRLLRGVGLPKGSIADRLRAFARDPRFLYGDDDAGRDRAVAEMNGWLDRARAALPASFGTIPHAADVVRAHRMRAADEAAARAGYRTVPDPANSFDGGYFVDLAHIRRRPSWSLRSVVHHELLPGHMMQLPLQETARPHPLRLAYAPGFVEGWGIYAEQLAAEMGLFADDPAGEIGYLQWMLFRAGRGLVDSGVHLHGWTVQEAEARLAALQGEPAIFASFAKDAMRVSLEPASFAGQAWNWHCLATLAAASGAAASGARRHFHDAALSEGALPIAMLRAPAQRKVVATIGNIFAI